MEIWFGFGSISVLSFRLFSIHSPSELSPVYFHFPVILLFVAIFADLIPQTKTDWLHRDISYKNTHVRGRWWAFYSSAMRTFVGHRNRNTRKQFQLTEMRLIFGRLTEPNQTITPLTAVMCYSLWIHSYEGVLYPFYVVSQPLSHVPCIHWKLSISAAVVVPVTKATESRRGKQRRKRVRANIITAKRRKRKVVVSFGV